MTNWNSHGPDRRLAMAAATPVGVICRSLFGVSQHVESGQDVGETGRVRGGALAAVGMQVANAAAVGARDLGWRRGGKDAKEFVQISVEISHVSYPFPDAQRRSAVVADPCAPKWRLAMGSSPIPSRQIQEVAFDDRDRQSIIESPIDGRRRGGPPRPWATDHTARGPRLRAQQGPEQERIQADGHALETGGHVFGQRQKHARRRSLRSEANSAVGIAGEETASDPSPRVAGNTPGPRGHGQLAHRLGEQQGDPGMKAPEPSVEVAGVEQQCCAGARRGRTGHDTGQGRGTQHLPGVHVSVHRFLIIPSAGPEVIAPRASQTGLPSAIDRQSLGPGRA